MTARRNAHANSPTTAERGGMRARGFRPSKPKALPPYDPKNREELFWKIVEEEMAAGRSTGSPHDPRGYSEFLGWIEFRNEATPEGDRWPRGALENLMTVLILNADWITGDSLLFRLYAKYRAPKPAAPNPTHQARMAAAEEERVAREQLQQVMAILDVSYKRAYVIMREGTGLPEQARLLANHIEGTNAADWMRAKSRPGRHAPPIAQTILAIAVEGCSLLDFTEAVPRHDTLRFASDAFRWIEERYRMREPLAKSFSSFDELSAAVPDIISRGQVHQLWCRFKEWRADKITAAMEADVLASELAYPG